MIGLSDLENCLDDEHSLKLRDIQDCIEEVKKEYCEVDNLVDIPDDKLDKSKVRG